MNARHDPPLPAEPARAPRRALPLLLIAAGGLILLLNADIGALLWRVLLPVALLAFGLDLLTEGRHRRRITAAALVALLVLTPLVGMLDRVERPPAARVERAQRPAAVAADIDRLTATINLTAGSLEIAALDDSRADAIVEVNPALDLDRVFHRDGRRGFLTVDPGPVSRGDYRLAFAPDLLLDLSINVGAGAARPLDFSDLQLEHLRLHVGAGSAVVSLSPSGVMEIIIESDAGEVVLDVPANLEAQVMASARIGDVVVGDRFELVNGAYVTPGWSDSAPDRARITIESGVGRVRVR
jgi:hypothetical protein